MVSQSPHCITITIGASDRSKVWLMWGISEDLARDLAEDLAERFGDPDHEFFADAESIDVATRAAFGTGRIAQHDAWDDPPAPGAHAPA